MMQSAVVIPMINLYHKLLATINYAKYILNYMLYRIGVLLWSMKSVTSPTDLVPLIIHYDLIYLSIQ